MPAVGNTHEIQNGRNAVKDWFMAAAKSIKPSLNEGGTAQGFYVVAADGKSYVFNNNRSVERVMAAMEQGLRGFKSNPPRQVSFTGEEVKIPFAPAMPTGGVKLRVHTRIRPVPAGSAPSNENVARDFVWITSEEVEGLRQGREFPMTLAKRLARFHLIDNVRGEPEFWRSKEILALEPKLTGNGGFLIRFSLANRANSRGLVGELQGQATFKDDKLFSLFAFTKAEAWGRSAYTPEPPPGKFPLLIGFELDQTASEVAPQAALMGREYLNP